MFIAERQKRLLQKAFVYQLQAHPLPWHIVEKPVREVVASDGVIVFTTRNSHDAEEIIEMAKEYEQEFQKIKELADKISKNQQRLHGA